MVIAQVENGID